MVPRPEIRDAILGVLGFALFLYPTIQLHGFIFLSNHYHLLLTTPDAETLARFMCFLNGNIARKVSKLIERTGAFWSRRYEDIPVIDDRAAIARMEYLLSNSCKEHLVASPLDWPGASSARALALGEPLRGPWVDETSFFRARRRGEEVTQADFTRWFEIPLAPLVALEGAAPEERLGLYREMIGEIERSLHGLPIVGIERILAQSPLDHPDESKHSPAPRCHASTKEAWLEFRIAERQRDADYRQASRQIRAGKRAPHDVPEGTLPPPLHFRPDFTRQTESRVHSCGFER